MRAGRVAFVFAFFVACTDLGGLSSTSGDPDAAAAPADAGADADAALSVRSCDAGASMTPVEVAPLEVPVGAVSCNLPAALVVDGVVAGVDRAASQSTTTIDGVSVSTCVRFDFGAPRAATGLTAWVRASSSACGVSACISASDAGCGTGRSYSIFTSDAPDVGSMHFLSGPTLTDTLQAQELALTSTPVRYVLLCRTTAGEERDDLEIDGISITCR